MDKVVFMFKTKMTRRTSVNMSGIIVLGFAVCLISCILLRASVLPISIDSIMDDLNRSVHHWHVLVVGFLPIYVALMVFGVAVAGIYLATLLHHWATRFFKKSQ